MKRAKSKRDPGINDFFCLNLENVTQPCAGLDQSPILIGKTAVEILIGQLYRNEYGIPTTRPLVTLPAIWRDGPTLRNQSP
jgi:LacI family transcriptional regulator